jgi:uncharacterized protein with GYD domain
MKFVLLGSISKEWAAKQAQRAALARAKAKSLGIKIESVYYTQGAYDFVDVADAPDPEAMLAFSVWYANKGLGRMQTMPAFGEAAFVAATKKAK